MWVLTSTILREFDTGIIKIEYQAARRHFHRNRRNINFYFQIQDVEFVLSIVNIFYLISFPTLGWRIQFNYIQYIIDFTFNLHCSTK